MLKRVLACLSIVVAIIAAFSGRAAIAAKAEREAPPLFATHPPTTVQASQALAGANTKAETIHFNPAVFEAKPGDPFTIPLGANPRVLTQRVTHDQHGESYVGQVEGSKPPRNVILSRASNGMVVGRIAAPSAVYQVKPADTNVSLLIRQSSGNRNLGDTTTRRTGSSSQPPVPLRRPASYERHRQTETSSKNTVIDVLIAYSPGVLKAYPGPALNAFLRSLIAAANTTYSNSHIKLTLHLAGALEVGFGDGAWPSTQKFADCIMDNHAADISACNLHDVKIIDALRAAIGADEVFFLGTGRLVDTGFGYKSFGFGVEGSEFKENVDPGSGFSGIFIGYSDETAFVHEIGHNLGAGHDLEAPANDGAFAYSHGHRFSTDDHPSDGTIMSYSGHESFIFSSPDYDCGGDPCGEAQTEDNARTIRETMGYVASYSDVIPEIQVDSGGEAPYPNQVFKLSNTGNNPLDSSFTMALLEDGHAERILSDKVESELDLTHHYTLPANLNLSKSYKLRFTSNDRPGFSFTIPLKLTFKRPVAREIKLIATGQTRAVFSVSAIPYGMDTTVAVALAHGQGTSSTALIDQFGAPADAYHEPPTETRFVTVDGLTCGTKYGPVTPVIKNKVGDGEDQAAPVDSFQTAPCGGVKPSLAQVSAKYSANDNAETITETTDTQSVVDDIRIAYGQTHHYGMRTDAGTIKTIKSESAKKSVAVFHLNHLPCGQTYHYRAEAYTSTGENVGADKAFKTRPCKAGTLAVAGPDKVAPGEDATYTVTRTDGTDGDLIVHFGTADGKAKGNKNYLARDSIMRFADGETKKTVTVPVFRSPTATGSMDFTFKISTDNPAASVADDSVKTRIEYDAAPKVTDGSITVKSGQSKKGTLKATGDDLTFAIGQKPEHGTVTIADAAKGTFKYTADASYSGTDSFTFTVTNGHQKVASGTENVHVKSPPPPPSNNNKGSTPASSGGGGGGAMGFLFIGWFLFAATIRRERSRA